MKVSVKSVKIISQSNTWFSSTIFSRQRVPSPTLQKLVYYFRREVKHQMYCKVTHPILSYAAAQQQCHQLDQFILNLQTPGSSASPSPSDPSAASTSSSSTPGAGAPDAQLPGQSQPSQLNQLNQLNQAQAAQPKPSQLIPLATVLDSAQGDASWFASPRNAQHCEPLRRELEPGEAGSPLLYRAAGCNRARRCCCTCTKLCAHRCLHD